MTRRLAAIASGGLFALAIALTGCAAAEPAPTPVPEATRTADGPCEQVTVVVDFGPIDEDALESCAEEGVAVDVLAAAGVTTEGTADYGDQVVCRVNGEPAADEPVELDGQDPFTETCETLNALAYWALWVKPAPDAEWEYAMEGLGTLQLEDGQSVGLVYTPGTESTPPRG